MGHQNVIASGGDLASGGPITGGIEINIDNGGTLTDICVIRGEDVKRTKVLTTPYDLSQCFFDGLKKASVELYGAEDVARLLEEVERIRYSTTQGTNAICERKGPKMGIIVSGDAAAAVAKLSASDPELYAALVSDRVAVVDPQIDVDSEESILNVVKAINKLTATGANRLVVSFDTPDFAEAEANFRAVALRKYPRHLLGAVPITYGSDLSNDSDLTRRTWSALINSFLHPAMETFLFNAEGRLREYRTRNPLLIFRNDGAAARVAKTVAIKTYSSGPRGGMEGVKSFARLYGLKDAVSMDVGGTTTDYGHVHLDGVRELPRGLVEGVEVSFPLCDIPSIGAGGSSIFKVENGKIKIGPESVGAVPGPACFARGGKDATITDASLLIGIFDPVSYFGGDLRIDIERARAAVKANIADPLHVSVEKAVLLMQQAYEQKIADELVKFSKPLADTTLLAFGGAGPLNACGVAEKAGIKTVIIPKLAAVFSAYGIGTCDIAQSYQVTVNDLSQAALKAVIAKMRVKAERDMFSEGVAAGDYQETIALVAWFGTEKKAVSILSTIDIPADFKTADSVEVELIATKVLKTDHREKIEIKKSTQATASGRRSLLQEGMTEATVVPIYRLADMGVGYWGAGPAIIEEDYFTSVIRQGWNFVVSDAGDVVLTKG